MLLFKTHFKQYSANSVAMANIYGLPFSSMYEFFNNGGYLNKLFLTGFISTPSYKWTRCLERGVNIASEIILKPR